MPFNLLNCLCFSIAVWQQTSANFWIAWRLGVGGSAGEPVFDENPLRIDCF